MSAYSPLIDTDPAYPRHQRIVPRIIARLPRDELAHDHLHISRVYRWCLRLAYENGDDGDLAGAAGLVHDCVPIAKDSLARPLASEAASQVAAGILPEAGYDADEYARIVEAVRTCSWSRGLAATDTLGRILQDADRLDALGVIGLLRTATCAQDMAPRTHGRLYDGGDPMAKSGRAMDDRMAMLDHLHCKLLTLNGHFHCESAQREAAQRHQVLLQLRDQLLRELAGVHPPVTGRYDALLLDFDGTLVDSAPAIMSCLRHAAAVSGVALAADEASLRSLIGRPLKDSLATWGLQDAALDRAYEAYRQAWIDGARDRCQLYPGVLSTLEELRARGCRLFIASAKDHQRLPEAVARMGLSACVEDVYGALPGEGNKHALLQRATADLGKQATAMVGDRCFDGEAAQAAGLPFIAATYGYGSMTELAACSPKAWLGHFSDLLACCPA